MSTELQQRLLDASPEERQSLLQTEAVRDEDVFQLSERARGVAGSNPAEALRIAEVAWQLAEHLNTAKPRAWALRARGVALRAQGQLEPALKCFAEGVEWAEKADDALLAAQIPIAGIDVLAQLGRYAEATRQARDLEKRLRDLGANEDAAKAVANAGAVYFHRESYQEALNCWQRALDYFQSADTAAPPVQLAIARLKMNIGNMLTHLNRVPEALQMYADARPVLEEGGVDLLIAGVDGNMGFLLFMSGRYADALQSFEKARQRFETLQQPKDLAKCDREIADVYLALNLIPEAQAAYERALPVLREYKMTLEVSRCQVGMAGALFAQSRPEEAFQILDEAENSLNQEQNAVGAARIQLLRAQHLHRAAEERRGEEEIGRQGEDLSLTTQPSSLFHPQLNASLRTFRRHKLPLGIAQARLLRAEHGVTQGQRPTRSLRQLLLEAQDNGWVSLEWRIETALARSAMNSKKPRAALTRYRRAADAVERLRQLMPGEDFRIHFFQDKMRLHEEMLGLLLDSDAAGSREEAFHLIERVKSRTLLEQMSATRLPHSPEPEEQAQRQQLEDLRAQLNWNHATREQFGENDARLHGSHPQPTSRSLHLEQEFLRVQRRLQSRNGSRQHATTSTLLTLNGLQTLLDGEQIVEYMLLKDEVLACVISRNRIQIVRSLASLAEARELLQRLHFQWTKMRSRVYSERFAAQMGDAARDALNRLHELLWEPVAPLLLENRLEDGAENRLTIIPHGILHEIPFHALYDGERYVLDDWECTQAPSSAIWHNCRLRPDVTAADSLLLGISDEGIAQVRAEADALRGQIANLNVLQEEAATLAAVPQEGAYRYLHFATHALFRQDNPLFSGLRLWDGWLIAYDLHHRRLECDLATLAACDTGMNLVTAGDELHGLARGFLAAGARSVLACLWAAHDATTAQLMPAFYARLAGGMGKAAALRASQLELREQFPHPYYWASFALIGAR